MRISFSGLIVPQKVGQLYENVAMCLKCCVPGHFRTNEPMKYQKACLRAGVYVSLPPRIVTPRAFFCFLGRCCHIDSVEPVVVDRDVMLATGL